MTACIAGLAIASSNAGLFRILEWLTLDQFFLIRPQEPIDKRIVVVTIDEPDIKYVKQWPMSDRVMARVIRNINAQQPRGIIIDIYRDLPVEPGHQELVALLPKHPQIIMISQLGGETIARIPPPAVLQGSSQVGFNDILVDPDGLIRRALLFQDDGEDVASAFALKLAMLYLAPDGIVPEQDPIVPEWIRLGHTTLQPFTGSDGGYVKADDAGYQILLDFGATAKPLQAFSLTDLLAGQMLDADVVDGRELKPLIERFLANESVSYLHAHFARRGCYAALIERSPTT